MIQSVFVYESPSTDPYHNLAVEQYLLETVQPGQCILYLWQNQNTVVIGRNQNPWKECRTALLEAEGGRLARRLSGGGAVFHDLGNLNFTFLMPQEDYDLERQLSVIVQAVRSLGIPAERSGRNDILAEGRKFSGNAFYKNGRQAYHHGTLLVDADLSKMNRYLSPSKAKLQSKGVDSVRSRVVNLRELNPQITVASLKEALTEAFGTVCRASALQILDSALDNCRIRNLAEKNSSWDWLYGQKIPFTLEREARFPWGGVLLQLDINQGDIQRIKLWTDAMDGTWVSELESRLQGCRLEQHALAARMQDSGCSAAKEIMQVLLAE